jgi:hypothetical protein
MFYVYCRLHPAKAAIALHLEYVKRRDHSSFLVTALAIQP